jgi:hypothetical protein
MRITYGEFDWPDSGTKSHYIRQRFLGAVTEHEPRVGENLYSSCVVPYRQLVNVCGFQVDSTGMRKLVRESLRKNPPSAKKEIDSLSQSVGSVLATWHLSSDWLHDISIDTLKTWSFYDRKPDRLWFEVPIHGGAVPATPEVPDGLLEYEPLFDSRESYLYSLQEYARERLERDLLFRQGDMKRAAAFAKTITVPGYCDEVERCYEAAGFLRSKPDEKRNLSRDLEWTIRFQVQGEKFTDIAGESVEISTVIRAVEGMLNLTGLQKRQNSKRGRQRGSKNNPILANLGHSPKPARTSR